MYVVLSHLSHLPQQIPTSPHNKLPHNFPQKRKSSGEMFFLLSANQQKFKFKIHDSLVSCRARLKPNPPRLPHVTRREDGGNGKRCK